ncbi:MAG: methylcrotonoyl-CoA carboxylase, partial [Chloroflexi bacterium]
MTTLDSRVRRDSAEFQDNERYHRGLLDTLQERVRCVHEGGGPEAVAKHRSRGKLLARERIDP